jgi:2-succinyl-5-enolpyruvyl-6-hydroxy-3-cyclohexene-1-carboxylate synthase
LVNEALLERYAPVHINVPISEPLFEFSVAHLPEERKIELIPAEMSGITLTHVCRMFLQARRPMLIAGQPMNPLMDEAVQQVSGDDDYVPDFVLYTGGSIVSKRLKHFLRKAKETWVVNREGVITDTFMNLTKVIQGDGEVVADMIRFNLEQQPHPFVRKWETLIAGIRQKVASAQTDNLLTAAVKCFEESLRGLNDSFYVHYANSTAIRLANTYAWHPVYCNRGVNGIEGSLSAAAGFSLVSHLSPHSSLSSKVFCVTGDLSFFYDQNALWNQNLRGNLRILLLNNGKGGIFSMLPGLEQSAARDALVAASHHTTAEGICRQNAVGYCMADDMEQIQQGIHWLLTEESERPLLFEVRNLNN